MDSVAYVRLRQRILDSRLGRPLRTARRALRASHPDQDAIDNAHLRAVLAAVLRPDSNCIDVGAHQGAVLADMLRLAPGGRHFAFEPLPHLAQKLAIDYPVVNVREVALSDRVGNAEFVHVVSRPGFSGFKQRKYPRVEELQRLQVRTERLDDVLPADYAPSFIKIDVEGAEYQVLRGAEETIRRHQPFIAFEHGLGSADYFGTRPEDVFGLLVEGLGMRLFDLEGDGPYAREAFIDTFNRHERVNFLARP